MAETWLFLNSGDGEPGWNMAFDEALLQECSKLGVPILRFYSWKTPAASFGYFQKHSEIAEWTVLRPLVRRPTGGGLVPHVSDWTYSLSLPPNHWWYKLKAMESYELLHQWVSDSFIPFQIKTELAPEARKEIPGQCFAGAEKFDLLLGGQKIAGAAQRRLKNGLLIQGSIQRQPSEVRREMWEEEFVRTASLKWGVAWQALTDLSKIEPCAHELSASKYLSADYNRRR